MCAVEVYNERIKDLLADDARGEDCELFGKVSDTRTIIQHKDKSPLVECEVGSVPTAMNLLARALRSRAVDSTRYVIYIQEG